MILAPVYCSSEPPPASGPVRSKITPILIFFSWAEAETAIPSIAPAAISPPSTRAALTTSIDPSLQHCVFTFLLVGAHHRGSTGRCQAADVLWTPRSNGSACPAQGPASKFRQQQT